MLNKEIKALRKKLPYKGFAKSIIEASESRVNAEQIRNFFQCKKVKDELVDIIIDATNIVLENEERKLSNRKKRLLKKAKI